MDGQSEFNNPKWGRNTGFYLCSDDGSLKVATLVNFGIAVQEHWDKIQKSIQEYAWNEGDLLLCTYPKNGTHFLWEIMNMLQRNSSDYIEANKVMSMLSLTPISEMDFPKEFPRIFNTHFRCDLLPKEFQRCKMVLGIRNPKDAAVSFYHHEQTVSMRHPDPKVRAMGEKLTFSEYLQCFISVTDQPFGIYFDYVETMWNIAKNNPNVLVVFFEDLKKSPLAEIQRINDFMGTECSLQTMADIVDATAFDKMKTAKDNHQLNISNVPEKPKDCADDENASKSVQTTKTPFMYRKGEVGDWKNHFTVADNEMMDAILQKWPVSREIPFQYE